jgi:hypothetical protein
MKMAIGPAASSSRINDFHIVIAPGFEGWRPVLTASG